jgi:hypothetical protein
MHAVNHHERQNDGLADQQLESRQTIKGFTEDKWVLTQSCDDLAESHEELVGGSPLDRVGVKFLDDPRRPVRHAHRVSGRLAISLATHAFL